MTTRKLTFHTDPGHGWLEVSRADLDTLAIADRVTPYSYQRAGRVYLEEDIDASLYLEAARAAGWTVNIREQHRDPSPIRNLQPYLIAKHTTTADEPTYTVRVTSRKAGQ